MKKYDKSPEKFISLYHGETWCLGDERETPKFMTYKGKEKEDSVSPPENFIN